MCDGGNRRAGRGEPDEQPTLGAAAVWLATTAGQTLRERLAIQLAADTQGLRMEVGADGRLMARFHVRTVAFEVAFPDDFPRDQPWMRWRGPEDQHWVVPMEVEPPVDAATPEARAFAFLEVTVPRVVAGFAAQKCVLGAADGAPPAPEVAPQQPTAGKRRRARRLAVETVVIIHSVRDDSEGGSDLGD